MSVAKHCVWARITFKDGQSNELTRELKDEHGKKLAFPLKGMKVLVGRHLGRIAAFAATEEKLETVAGPLLAKGSGANMPPSGKRVPMKNKLLEHFLTPSGARQEKQRSISEKTKKKLVREEASSSKTNESQKSNLEIYTLVEKKRKSDSDKGDSEEDEIKKLRRLLAEKDDTIASLKSKAAKRKVLTISDDEDEVPLVALAKKTAISTHDSEEEMTLFDEKMLITSTAKDQNTGVLSQLSLNTNSIQRPEPLEMENEDEEVADEAMDEDREVADEAMDEDGEVADEALMPLSAVLTPYLQEKPGRINIALDEIQNSDEYQAQLLIYSDLLAKDVAKYASGAIKLSASLIRKQLRISRSPGEFVMNLLKIIYHDWVLKTCLLNRKTKTKDSRGTLYSKGVVAIIEIITKVAADIRRANRTLSDTTQQTVETVEDRPQEEEASVANPKKKGRGKPRKFNGPSSSSRLGQVFQPVEEWSVEETTPAKIRTLISHKLAYIKQQEKQRLLDDQKEKEEKAEKEANLEKKKLLKKQQPKKKPVQAGGASKQ